MKRQAQMLIEVGGLLVDATSDYAKKCLAPPSDMVIFNANHSVCNRERLRHDSVEENLAEITKKVKVGEVVSHPGSPASYWQKVSESKWQRLNTACFQIGVIRAEQDARL